METQQNHTVDTNSNITYVLNSILLILCATDAPNTAIVRPLELHALGLRS